MRRLHQCSILLVFKALSYVLTGLLPLAALVLPSSHWELERGKLHSRGSSL